MTLADDKRTAEEMKKLTDEQLLAECENQSIVHWSIADELARRFRDMRSHYNEMAHAVAALSDPDEMLQGIADGPEKDELEAMFGKHRRDGWV